MESKRSLLGVDVDDARTTMRSPPRRKNRRSVKSLVLAAGLIASACNGSNVESELRPERIILLSMDTVRADRVPPLADVATMPTLNRIARRGVWFRHFYAASNYTIPSHATMFTGLDPAEHGLHDDRARLSPELMTLAEVLRAGGYATHAHHEGGYLKPRFGFARGFDSYNEHPRVALVKESRLEIAAWLRNNAKQPYFLFLHTYAAHYPYGGFERYREAAPDLGLPDDVEIARLRSLKTAAAVGRLPRETRRHCSLYNAMTDSHGSMLPCGKKSFPSDFTRWIDLDPHRDALLASYDARLRLIDELLADIERTLRELSQWDDTLLIVTSDHGESFFEHGQKRHDLVPFEEVLSIPFIVSYPRRLGSVANRAIAGLAGHLDLMPTLLSLAGLSLPGQQRGIDLAKVILGAAEIPPSRVLLPAVFRVAHQPQEPLRRVWLQGRIKYVEGHASFGDSEGLLFDLDRDPGERENLRLARPEIVARARQGIRAHAQALAPTPPVHQQTGEPLRLEDSPVKLSEAEIEALVTLGYIE